MNQLILVYTLAIIGVISVLSIEQAFADHSIVGNFEGKFDRETIDTEGKFRIGGESNIFTLVGNFENTGVSHWNPQTGQYVISNPNCQNIEADLVLESDDTKLELEYTGKNCKYGFFSYVIGTFVTEGGEGRITFVADHHSNNVYGQLKGVVTDMPEKIVDDVSVTDSVTTEIEE